MSIHTNTIFLRLYFSVALLFAFVFGDVAAQSSRADSLRQLIKNSTGTQRADALNEYGYFVLSYDYVEAKKIIQQAFELSQKLGYTKGLSESFLYKGTIEDRMGNDSLSSIFFANALLFSKQSKESHLSGRILTAIGLSKQHKNQLDSAEWYYHRSYDLLKDSLNPLYLSFLYLRFSELSELKNNHSAQLTYLKRSWEIRRKMADPHPLVWAGANLANYYIQRGKFDSAWFFINAAQQALGADTVSEEISVIYRNKAVISARKGNHKAALDFFSKSKKFYELNPFKWNLTDLLMEIGSIQADASNYETALKYYFQALKLSETNHFDQKTSQLNYRIARAYYYLQQNKVSEEFARKSLIYSRAHRQELDEAYVENLLGLLDKRRNKFDSALIHFNRSLQLRQKNDNLSGVSGSLGNIGELYEKINNFKKAEEYGLRSLAMAEKADFASGKCYSYQAMSQLYMKMHDYPKAKRYLDMCERLAKQIQFHNVVAEIYKSKSEFWQAQGDYRQALLYAHKYEALKDSIFNTTVENRILTMQYDFELDKKDTEIKLLNQQQELQQDRLKLQQAEINRQRVAIIVGILILVVGGIATYLIFRLYTRVKRLNREISEQNEEITAQSEELIEANDVLGKLNAEISEKKRQIENQAEELSVSNQTIARINESLEEKIKIRTSELKEAYRELDTFFYRSSHDFRRPLTTFMGLAEVAKVMVKDKSALELFEKVNETARNLDKMLSKLQSVSAAGADELSLTEISFKNIFQTEIHVFDEEIIRKKIQVKTEFDLKRPFYSYPTLLNFVVHNLLENSILFANDEKPEIQIFVKELTNEVVLSVKDNGQGIDPAYLPRVFEMYFRASERSTGNGLGLYIVKKMVDKMNGRVEIKSELGKMTEVNVFLPFTSR